MKTQTVQAKNGTAIIAPGEIVNLTGDWTGAELTRLIWKAQFMEGV